MYVFLNLHSKYNITQNIGKQEDSNRYRERKAEILMVIITDQLNKITNIMSHSGFFSATNIYSLKWSFFFDPFHSFITESVSLY